MTSTWQIMINNKPSYLKNCNVNLCRWAMPQKLPINGFKWVINKSDKNRIFFERSCSVPWKIAWTSQWFKLWSIEKSAKVIKFNQEAWLKPYFYMNTELRKNVKNDFEKKKDFFKLMNNGIFGKTVENVRKYRDMKLVATDKRRIYLVSEPNYHTVIFFS